ncbi:protein piccolo isoform X2, partial [Biomphalaria glabrata]
MEREASLSEMTESGSQLCPVCNKNHLPMNRDGTGSSMTVCVQCEQRTCRNCGAFKTAHPSK